MPNRILRDGILRSEKIAQLAPMAELFYRRLMSVVDDFGRYYAKPALLLSDCFPIRPSWADEPSLSLWVEECVTSGLITRYSVSGTEYLEIQNFGQRVREGRESKFPSLADFGRQVPPISAAGGSRASSPSSPTPPNTPTAPSAEREIVMSPSLDEQFQEYKRLFEIVGNPIPEDFANGSFCWRSWTILDYHQRVMAIDSLKAREAAGISVLHSAASYLQKLEYKRQLRKAATNGNGRMSAAERIDKAISEA